MSTSNSDAVVRLGDKLKEAGLTHRKKAYTRYSDQLIENVLTELNKPGAKPKEISHRFNVPETTVASWRLKYIGRILAPRRPRDAAKKASPPESKPQPPAMLSVAAAIRQDAVPATDTVTISRSDARTLALIVRDAVRRMDGADEAVLGRMALLALKLAG